MSGSRIRVDVNTRTTVNVSRSSGGVESRHFSVEAQSAESQSLLPPSFPPAVAPPHVLQIAPFQRSFGSYVRYRSEFHYHCTVLRSSHHDPERPSEVTPPDPPKRNVGPKDDTVAPNIASQTITNPGPSHYSREGRSYNLPDWARHYIKVVKRKNAETMFGGRTLLKRAVVPFVCSTTVRVRLWQQRGRPGSTRQAGCGLRKAPGC